MVLRLFTMKYSLATLLGVIASTSAKTATTTQPSLTDIAASAATVAPFSPVSNVDGVAFKRFYQIWFENIVCARR